MDRHLRGLTLLELIITVAVLGILLGLGVPAFRQLSAATRAQGVFHELTASLAMARSSAITRGAPVVVCPSSDGLTCRRDSVWDQGWITVQARAGRQRNSHSPKSTLIHASSGGRRLVIKSTRRRIRFQPTGLSEGSNFSLCVYASADGPLIGRVAVSQGGRIRSERTQKVAICGNSP